MGFIWDLYGIYMGYIGVLNIYIYVCMYVICMLYVYIYICIYVTLFFGC